MDDSVLKFNFPVDVPKIIKVVGVGGGGGNAVSYMHDRGFKDVSFLLCNTDNQALLKSSVEAKLTLGKNITQGLGAGNKPEKARAAAEESAEDIARLLDDGTKMVFITAGMGGGTGTGAAPIIAKIAKEMGILTVGIVTIPFIFEGERKIIQALNGVEEISKNVDALLVINNERLREIYSNFTIKEAFAKADDTLNIAAKSIAEIITLDGIINLDFADVNTTMKDGGVALMSNGYGKGKGRLEAAISDALASPLLNNNDIFNAKKILFNISFSNEKELQTDELSYINDFMLRFSNSIDVIWGTAEDDSLGESVKITILATGFGVDDIDVPDQYKKRIHDDLSEQKANRDLINKYYNRSDWKSNLSLQTKIVILSDEELVENSIISLLEEHPTYNRDPKLIAAERKSQNSLGAQKDSKSQHHLEKDPSFMESGILEEDNCKESSLFDIKDSNEQEEVYDIDEIETEEKKLEDKGNKKIIEF